MENQNRCQELLERFRSIQEKFDTIFGKADVTIDIQIHDQLMDTTVLMKHMQRSCQGAAGGDELCQMTADALERKMDALERYINRMIGSDVNNG